MTSTVLVMDDDDCARELLYLHLSGAGYKVLLAEDAIAAGRLLLKQPVNLLLADIEMPYMDGLEFVQAMRSDPAVARTPVIFVTSHAEHEGRAGELGAVACLRRPIRADHLLATVAKHAVPFSVAND
jgi:two-component system chemotaxis response regulator CheY